MSHHVDIVFCIDCTGSMNPVLDGAKTLALGFQKALDAALAEQQKAVDALRIKVVAFRDVFVDGKQSLVESGFFRLPDDAGAYAAFVGKLRAEGGGDEPESALEAFSLAMRSAWNSDSGRKRRIICILTDASAHPLEKAADAPPAHYPKDMPRSFDELAQIWEEEMDDKARRLLIFAPEAYPWTQISGDDEQSGFSAVIHYPSKAGDGLVDRDYKQIISLIANSI